MDLLISLARFLIDRLLFQNSPKTNNFLAMFEPIKDKMRKVLILTLSAFSCALLFVAGIVFFVLGVTSDYNQLGVGDSRMIGGLVLTVLALAGFVLSTAKTQWRDPLVAPPQRPHNQALQDALALAINEFIRDREFQRQQQARAQSQNQQSHAA